MANNIVNIKDIISLPMVMREEGSGTRRETERLLESRGVSLDKIHIAGIFGSTDAVKQAVKAGLGVSILSKFSVADELEHDILREIKLSDIQMKRRFYIVTHKKRTLPRSYNAFLEHILAEAKNL
jgi:DNA-binding transcriptional LysR family regulator